jgi:hypothetical protein
MIGGSIVATAQINYVRIDHNIFVNGIMGMVIHVGFDVQGLMGLPGEVAAYFNYWQGAPLRDFDRTYTTEDGHVSVGQNFTPGFEPATYPDLQLFMPYHELHMAPGATSHLMCQVRIWDKSQIVPQSLANSAWIQFYYSS